MVDASSITDLARFGDDADESGAPHLSSLHPQLLGRLPLLFSFWKPARLNSELQINQHIDQKAQAHPQPVQTEGFQNTRESNLVLKDLASVRRVSLLNAPPMSLPLSPRLLPRTLQPCRPHIRYSLPDGLKPNGLKPAELRVSKGTAIDSATESLTLNVGVRHLRAHARGLRLWGAVDG